jgi:hypothetical protein
MLQEMAAYRALASDFLPYINKRRFQNNREIANTFVSSVVL